MCFIQRKWAGKYSCVKKSCKGEKSAFCTMCANNFGIGYGGENAIKWHLETSKNKSNITSLKLSCSLTDWQSSTETNKLDEKVTRAETLFSGFIAEHNLSITTADHTGNLLREMIQDSKIAAKYICKTIKTTYVLTGAVAKDNIEELSKYLQSTWYGITTDDSSDETKKYLLVFARHEGPDSLIQTSLLDIPDSNVGSDAQTMFNTIDNAIKSAKLSWDYCMTYCSDSTNSVVEKKNSLLAKIKNVQQCGQSILTGGKRTISFNMEGMY